MSKYVYEIYFQYLSEHINLIFLLDKEETHYEYKTEFFPGEKYKEILLKFNNFDVLLSSKIKHKYIETKIHTFVKELDVRVNGILKKIIGEQKLLKRTKIYQYNLLIDQTNRQFITMNKYPYIYIQKNGDKILTNEDNIILNNFTIFNI